MVMPLRSKHIFSLNGSEMLKCLEMFSPQTRCTYDEHLIFPLSIECQHTSEDDDDYGYKRIRKYRKVNKGGEREVDAHVSPTIFDENL